MYIEKIKLNNYKIYFGENTVVLPPVSAKNVSIISGDNGCGKTTLLTALVWCLYGNQVQDVDEFFKEKITTIGGYRSYLITAMNRLAREKGETQYSVSIDLKGVKLPGISCDTMIITRSYTLGGVSDVLTIMIDGNHSELVDDMGKQLFIQDFVLPKELAKLFFFDAEKIVKLAEIQSLQEKELLSQAYSEVLGIRRYEDLRNSLRDLTIRFRRDSATEDEQIQFKELGDEIRRIENTIKSKEKAKEKLIEKKDELRIESDLLQEKLLREGNTLSVSEINALRSEKSSLLEARKELMSDFRELFELAPFAIAGKVLVEVENQLDIEDKYQKSHVDNETLKTKIDTIIDALKDDTSEAAKHISDEVKSYYQIKIRDLINAQFAEEDVNLKNAESLHNYSSEEHRRFQAIVSNLRTTYRERLQSLNRELRENKAALADVSKKLTDAESIETDELITSYRQEREGVERSIHKIDERTHQLSQEIGAFENSLLSKQKIFKDVAEKVNVNKEYQDKDQLVTRLIEELDDFIMRIRNVKKASIENRILLNIQRLMHKEGFIHKVSVEVMGKILDIVLYDKRGAEIKKNELSKGEQQLYATALLKALVEESGVDFPVFVDSPLQKFDEKHSHNIIQGFYPYISKQVVILPLLNKELSQTEYQLLMEHVGSVYIIENTSADSSEFRAVEPQELFGKVM